MKTIKDTNHSTKSHYEPKKRVYSPIKLWSCKTKLEYEQ